MTLQTSILQKAANQARGLAIDAVHACSSGHLGLPLGCAELGAVLFGHALSFNPERPRWINRDRFVLSAGLRLFALCGQDEPSPATRLRSLAGSEKTQFHPSGNLFGWDYFSRRTAK